MHRSIIKYFVLFILLLSQYIGAQEVELDSVHHYRPKIGLVLSGGAAHGFAHIGVLKRLEELNIPVDYITGTSMGAVIGGMYAMGYSADEIYEIASKQDWSLILNNSVPLDEVSIIEKRQYSKNPFYIVWNGKEFDLPRGIISGQKMDLILSRLYSPAHFINDFNNLPIPFKCIAVDIVSGDVVQFSEGNLGKTIRASMAIPSFFPPVEIDDRLFVDGGLLRNFPVEENSQMGADIMIGSYVGSKRKPKEELNSLIDILTQSTSLPNMKDAETQAEKLDVFIRPDCSKFSYLDFEAFDKFTELGYSASLDHDSILLTIRDQLISYDPEPKKEQLRIPDKIKITKIVLHSTNTVIQQLILGKLGFEKGDEVTLAEIEKGASEVYGMNYFSKVSYNFFNYEDGVGLELITEENDQFKIGISYNRFEHYGSALILNGEFRNLLIKPSRIFLSTRISSTPGIDFSHQYRFWRNPDWVAQSIVVAEFADLPFYNNGKFDRLYTQYMTMVGLDLIKEIDKTYTYSLGYNYKFNFLKPKAESPIDITSLTTKNHIVHIRFETNTLNRKSFTTEGLLLKGSVEYGFRTNQKLLFEKGNILENVENKSNVGILFQAKYYTSIHNRVSFSIMANGAFYTHDNFLLSTRLGGTNQPKNSTISFIGANDSEFLIGSHMYASTGLQIKFFEQLYLTPKVAFIIGNNMLKYVYENVETLGLFGAGIEIGVSTPIGPILLDVGYLFGKNRVAANIGIGHRHVF